MSEPTDPPSHLEDTQSRDDRLPATLREIIVNTRLQIELDKSRESIAALESKITRSSPTRDFFGALVADQSSNPNTSRTRVIAEVKRKSPSAGLIRPEYAQDGFLPEIIAQQYSKAGASAISCLTDEKFFGGDLSFIQRIKDSVSLPVLRKDFIIDPYQIYQARAYGADAILLIAECLTDEQISHMLDLARILNLGVLLEVHSKTNLTRVQPIMRASANKQVLLGINNRDLNRMITNLANTTDLVSLVEDRSILVSESGIKSAWDLAHLRYHSVSIVLVGEHLMRQQHPGKALSELLNPTTNVDNRQ